MTCLGIRLVEIHFIVIVIHHRRFVFVIIQQAVGHRDSEMKRNISLSWTPPDSGEGTVTFRLVKLKRIFSRN